MSLADLETVLDWAAAEGWNPGLDDAPAFLATDPDGFLVRKMAGQPVSAISVVNHSHEFAFLGLYLCHPDHRGEGHGLAIWYAGLAHAGKRTVGLDGVPDQQANYANSGFVKSGGACRFTGGDGLQAFGATRSAEPADFRELLEFERSLTGVDSRRFLTDWFQNTALRRTLVMRDLSGLAAYGTVRACRNGAKIGPFYARDAVAAQHLLGDLATVFAAGQVSLDVPEEASGLRALLNDLNFIASFSTARMFRGTPPATLKKEYRSIATLELG
jgi:hypothetical protein